MSVAAFLTELRSRDIQVWTEGDQLRCNAPAGVLTATLRDRLREQKGDILQFLRSAQALSQQQRAIVPLQTRGKHTPVFAVGGHNGDVFCFRALSQYLGDDQPFFGLEPPGRDEESEPLDSIEKLAAYFADQVRAFRPVGPCVIAGFCAGGTIAIELAQQLQREGADISSVVLFAGPYPSWYRFLPQLRHRIYTQFKRAKIHIQSLAALSQGRLAYIMDKVRHRREERAQLDATDPVMKLRARLERITLAAVRRYTPRRFAGRVTLILPSREWLRSGDALLARRWRPLAQQVEEFIGPDGCTGDNILMEPWVAETANLFRRAR